MWHGRASCRHVWSGSRRPWPPIGGAFPEMSAKGENAVKSLPTPMVNRVLTSPYLWWFDVFPVIGLSPSTALESAGVSDMAMTASSGVAQGAGSATPAGQAERSPFLRTTELLAPYQPAKPLITLSLGEPQHPVPDFVGPVLAKHIAEFGRYPLAKGIEPFRRAAADWLSTRFQLPRAIDPESEILVLNGSREGLFFAAITAARRNGWMPLAIG